MADVKQSKQELPTAEFIEDVAGFMVVSAW
jgi:hypothetical protein